MSAIAPASKLSELLAAAALYFGLDDSALNDSVSPSQASKLLRAFDEAELDALRDVIQSDDVSCRGFHVFHCGYPVSCHGFPISCRGFHISCHGFPVSCRSFPVYCNGNKEGQNLSDSG